MTTDPRCYNMSIWMDMICICIWRKYMHSKNILRDLGPGVSWVVVSKHFKHVLFLFLVGGRWSKPIPNGKHPKMLDTYFIQHVVCHVSHHFSRTRFFEVTKTLSRICFLLSPKHGSIIVVGVSGGENAISSLILGGWCRMWCSIDADFIDKLFWFWDDRNNSIIWVYQLANYH